MCGTFIGRSTQTPSFIKPKWYDMSKSNSIVTGNAGKGICHQFVLGEENRNILVRGGAGTGKTFLMKQLLTIVMADNQKAVVLDGDGEYLECEKNLGAQIITFSSKDMKDIFLSQTEIEKCRQSDVVIIDEGLRLYSNNPEGLIDFLDELLELNIRVFASFQAIPEEILHKFDVYLELDPLNSSKNSSEFVGTPGKGMAWTWRNQLMTLDSEHYKGIKVIDPKADFHKFHEKFKNSK